MGVRISILYHRPIGETLLNTELEGSVASIRKEGARRNPGLLHDVRNTLTEGVR